MICLRRHALSQGTAKSSNVESVAGGENCHFGIAPGIQNHYRSYGPFSNGSVLDLQINIDGLPLFKSSQVKVWPILCSITNVMLKDPFVVGIFSGKSKPGNLEEFLAKFSE